MFRWNTIRWKHFKIDSFGIIALAIIALAVILRIVLLALNMPETNSDEGTMGLEAMHIAFRGEHPVFLYGQDYMGVLEAYIAAFFFHLFGVSVFTLRIGMIIMFAIFMVSMYFLVSLLYTKKLALLTLALLGFGAASDVLIQQLRAVGGAIETLLFGSLVLLLASWLALTSGQTLAPRTRRWRLAAYGGWGLAAGLGIWVHLLVVPFVLAGGLILVFFCYRELLSWAPVLLLLGLVIGALPFILYNLHVPLAHNTLIATLQIHSGATKLIHSSQHLLRKRVIGTTLWTLPIATGLAPVCALTDLPYYGSPTTNTPPCIIVHGAWSLGYIVLFTIATLLAIVGLWKLWLLRRAQTRSWNQEERRAAVIHFARLMILVGAGLTLLLYVISPLSALEPWSTRYLVGLLITVPAVLWPLMGAKGIDRVGSPPDFPPARGNESPRLTAPTASEAEATGNAGADQSAVAAKYWYALRFAPLWALRMAFKRGILGLIVAAKYWYALPLRFSQGFGSLAPLWALRMAFKRGILVLISLAILAGTVATFTSLPSVEANNQQQEALIQDLRHIGATRVWLEYWTCFRLMFQSQEHIICAIPYGLIAQGSDRYYPYYVIVSADPQAVHMFPEGSPDAIAFAKKIAKQHYQRFDFDGYVVYQPE